MSILDRLRNGNGMPSAAILMRKIREVDSDIRARETEKVGIFKKLPIAGFTDLSKLTNSRDAIRRANAHAEQKGPAVSADSLVVG